MELARKPIPPNRGVFLFFVAYLPGISLQLSHKTPPREGRPASDSSRALDGLSRTETPPLQRFSDFQGFVLEGRTPEFPFCGLLRIPGAFPSLLGGNTLGPVHPDRGRWFPVGSDFLAGGAGDLCVLDAARGVGNALCMSSWLDFRGFRKLPRLAINFVEQHRAIHSLPQIVVLDGDDASETLPLPLVRPPLGQAVLDPTAHVAALGDERDSCGAFQGFEPPDDRQ